MEILGRKKAVAETWAMLEEEKVNFEREKLNFEREKLALERGKAEKEKRKKTTAKKSTGMPMLDSLFDNLSESTEDDDFD